MTAEDDEDLSKWFGDEGARVVERALRRALLRAKADGQRAMMRGLSSGPTFSTGRKALVLATLRASAATKRETATSQKSRSFHFKVTHVTRGKGRSGGKAAAHEAYIERESAVEKGAAQQAYLEDAGKLEFSVIGTIGSTLRERQQFWKRFAKVLNERDRIQHRIIAALPHELSPQGRRRAVEEFCRQTFLERGIPHFAAIHAPTEANDDRNFHAHIVFASRPAERLGKKWDFEVSGPRRQHPKMRSELQRIPMLRRRFAEAVNREIGKEDAGLPYFAGRMGFEPKHDLIRTPKMLLQHERSIEKGALHVRRIFQNEVIEVRRQIQATAGSLAQSLASRLRVDAGPSKRMRLHRSARHLERASLAMERSVAKTIQPPAVEQTVVSVIDRGGAGASADEANLLALVRAEITADLEQVEEQARRQRQLFLFRLWRIARQMRKVVEPRPRSARSVIRHLPLEQSQSLKVGQHVRSTVGQNASQVPQPTKRPTGRKVDPISR